MSFFSKDIRSLKRIFRNRDFYFVLTVYPLGAFLFVYALQKINSSSIFTKESQEMYSVISITLMMFFVAYTVYEMFDKKLFYKNQGDKLKLKQGEKGWRR